MTDAKYIQIADALRRRIDSRDLPPGERLPSETALEREFKASRNTVRQAIARLTNRGLLISRHGLGTFVTEKPKPLIVLASEEEGWKIEPESEKEDRTDGPSSGDAFISSAEAQGRVAKVREPVVQIVNATEGMAAQLGTVVGSQVVMRRQERLIDSKPWSVQASYYPMDIAAGTELMRPGDLARGTIRVLAELGHAQVGYRDQLRARMPSKEESDFLRTPPGVPVQSISRIAYDTERPIRLTTTVYSSDLNRIVYYIGTVPSGYAEVDPLKPPEP